jgi:MoaA/NifB/PqqE/SkfB family radical SAM enzyme
VSAGSTLARALEVHRCGAGALEGRASRVGEIYVMLTWDCNLRCRMCPFWGARGFCHTEGTGDESLEVERLLDWIPTGRGGPRTVTLSGGEPLLYPGWAALAHGLADRGVRVALTTNATGLASVAEEDLRSLHQINVSLDGPAAVLERLGRGGRGTLDAAIEGLRRVLDLGDEDRPRLRLLAVSTPEGAGQLAALLERLDRQGIAFDDLLLQHAMFLDEETARRQQLKLSATIGEGVPIWRALVDEPGRMDPAALQADLSALRARPERSMVSPTLEGPELAAYYGSGDHVPAAAGDFCLSPWLDLGITPAGDVWLCPGHPVGNIRTQGFESIWNGESARALRLALVRDGLFPGCRGCFYLYNYK